MHEGAPARFVVVVVAEPPQPYYGLRAFRGCSYRPYCGLRGCGRRLRRDLRKVAGARLGQPNHAMVCPPCRLRIIRGAPRLQQTNHSMFRSRGAAPAKYRRAHARPAPRRPPPRPRRPPKGRRPPRPRPTNHVMVCPRGRGCSPAQPSMLLLWSARGGRRGNAVAVRQRIQARAPPYRYGSPQSRWSSSPSRHPGRARCCSISAAFSCVSTAARSIVSVRARVGFIRPSMRPRSPQRHPRARPPHAGRAPAPPRLKKTIVWFARGGRAPAPRKCSPRTTAAQTNWCASQFNEVHQAPTRHRYAAAGQSSPPRRRRRRRGACPHRASAWPAARAPAAAAPITA